MRLEGLLAAIGTARTVGHLDQPINGKPLRIVRAREWTALTEHSPGTS